MGCTVHELQQRMSSREFAEWMAYDKIEPVGSLRDDYHTAMICAVIANANRDPEAPIAEVGDFLLKFEVPDGEDEDMPTKSPEEIYDVMRTWAILAGGAA